MAVVTMLSLLVGVSVVTLLAVLFGIVRRRKRHKSVNLQEGTLYCTINACILVSVGYIEETGRDAYPVYP